MKPSELSREKDLRADGQHPAVPPEARHVCTLFLLLLLGLPGWFSVFPGYGLFASFLVAGFTLLLRSRLYFLLARCVARAVFVALLPLVIFGGYGWISIATGVPQKFGDVIISVVASSATFFFIGRYYFAAPAPPDTSDASDSEPDLTIRA